MSRPTVIRSPRQAARGFAIAGLWIGLALLQSACGRAPRPPAPEGLDLEGGAGEQRYLAPPAVMRATPARDGGVTVAGSAPPRAQVVFSTPEGQSYAATTDGRGAWRVRLPSAPLPRLYALSSLAQGRMVHAEGAVLTIPRGAAVMVRAGYAALPLEVGGDTDIVAMDFDPAGFAGVSGTAPPHSAVQLAIDGVAAGVTQADAQGRFALLAANRRLGFGPHDLEAKTGAGVVRRVAVLAPAEPLTAVYSAQAAPGGWRVEWALNGGGVQTTVLIADPRG